MVGQGWTRPWRVGEDLGRISGSGLQGGEGSGLLGGHDNGLKGGQKKRLPTLRFSVRIVELGRSWYNLPGPPWDR